MGIELPQTSKAAGELEAIRTVMKWISGGGEPPVSEDYRRIVQDALCGIQIIELVLRRARQGCDLRPFVRHFKLLKSGSMRLSAESNADEANHKLFELLVGLVVAAFGSNVKLAHPTRQDIRNPDVAVTIGGRRWGFACKVPHSRSAQSLHDNILKGFRQVDAADVNVGLVVLSPKNILRSSDLLTVVEKDGRPGIQFFTPERLGILFEQTFNPLMDQVEALLRGVVRDAQSVKVSRIPVVYWLFTAATLARKDGVVRPTIYARTGGWELPLPPGPIDAGVGLEVLERMQKEFASTE